MKNSKILVRINNLNEIKNYKKESINNFLFALKGLSIGYNCFELDDLKNIDCNVYLLLNKVLDTNDISYLKKLISKLGFVKGIFFEDVGVYHLLKDIKIPLVWNQGHFVLNSNSINIWLDNVYSACLSNELTITEISNILNKVSSPVVLPILGLNMAMYSRRHLLSNYSAFKDIKALKEVILKPNDDISFLTRENEDGTVLFYNKYYNLLSYINNIDDSKILFYYIDPNNLTCDDVINIINGEEVHFDNRFINNKTVYRVGDLK